MKYKYYVFLFKWFNISSDLNYEWVIVNVKVNVCFLVNVVVVVFVVVEFCVSFMGRIKGNLRCNFCF